jgi:hypothetical protein
MRLEVLTSVLTKLTVFWHMHHVTWCNCMTVSEELAGTVIWVDAASTHSASSQKTAAIRVFWFRSNVYLV